MTTLLMLLMFPIPEFKLKGQVNVITSREKISYTLKKEE